MSLLDEVRETTPEWLGAETREVPIPEAARDLLIELADAALGYWDEDWDTSPSENARRMIVALERLKK